MISMHWSRSIIRDVGMEELDARRATPRWWRGPGAPPGLPAAVSYYSVILGLGAIAVGKLPDDSSPSSSAAVPWIRRQNDGSLTGVTGARDPERGSLAPHPTSATSATAPVPSLAACRRTPCALGRPASQRISPRARIAFRDLPDASTQHIAQGNTHASVCTQRFPLYTGGKFAFNAHATDGRSASAMGLEQQSPDSAEVAAESALSLLMREGRNESDAVRTALVEAGRRRLQRSALADEVGRLAQDLHDTTERRGVMADMNAVGADWPE